MSLRQVTAKKITAKNILISICLLCFAPGIAHSTSFIERPFDQSVEDAPIIVRGKVKKVWSDWGKSSDGVKRIFTYAELDVTEVLKGDFGGNTITMRELGGEKDGVGMMIPGAAQFKQGEETLLFASDPAGDGTYPVRGMSMGKFELHPEEGGDQSIEGTTDEHGHSGTGSAKKVTLSGLRSLIKKQGDSAKSKMFAGKSDQQGTASPSPQPSQPPVKEKAPELQLSLKEEEGQGEASISRLRIWILIIGFIVFIGFLIGWALKKR